LPVRPQLNHGIERGERNVALRIIEAIAETLGISLSELFDNL